MKDEIEKIEENYSAVQIRVSEKQQGFSGVIFCFYFSVHRFFQVIIQYFAFFRLTASIIATGLVLFHYCGTLSDYLKKISKVQNISSSLVHTTIARRKIMLVNSSSISQSFSLMPSSLLLFGREWSEGLEVVYLCMQW